MKYVLMILMALVVSTQVYAQKPPKGSVTKAESYLGKGELDKAKAEIDVAVGIEKNATKSKTWYTRGKIYQQIALNGDESAIAETVAAVEKVREMENESNPTRVFSEQLLDGLYGEYFNQGAEDFNGSDYASAVANFERSLMVRPGDSITLYYAALAAYSGDDTEKSAEFFKTFAETGKANEDAYTRWIYLERELNKDYDAALAAIDMAKQQFPDNLDYMRDEINILMLTDRMDEAREKIVVAIERDPDNYTLYLTLAFMYDNLATTAIQNDDYETAKENLGVAVENYGKVLELKPDNVEATFNLGVVYVNLAKEHYDLARDMDYATYQKEGPAKMKMGDDVLKKGIPYMEKAHELSPEDVDILQALQQMYNQLKMNDKAMEVTDKIEALQGQ